MQTASETPIWLAVLPVVGKSIQVLLKSGESIASSYGRLATDGKFIHIGTIENIDRTDLPIITSTTEILIERISSITFQDLNDEPQILVP